MCSCVSELAIAPVNSIGYTLFHNFVHVISGCYGRGNRALVENGDVCVAVSCQLESGAAAPGAAADDKNSLVRHDG